ncbi:MAG: GntR family transcriptional regulator [Gemmatimonadales bacterium]
MPLTISIQPSSNAPIYRQIVEQVCAAVLAGRLREDEPLPSVRVLAEQLLVNPNTVSRAWGELVREGVLESRPGRGMFVTQRRQIYSGPERARRMEQAVTSLVSEAFVLGFTPEEILEQVALRTRAHVPTRASRSTPKGGSR